MEWNTHTQNWPQSARNAAGSGMRALHTTESSTTPSLQRRASAWRGADKQDGLAPEGCAVGTMLRIVPCFGARRWQLSAFSFSNREIGPHQCRCSDTFRRLLTKLLRIGGIGPIWRERAVAGPESPQEGWEGDPYNRPRNLLSAARTEGIPAPQRVTMGG